MFSSCKGDEEVVVVQEPITKFSYVKNGHHIQFINESEYGETFYWDFGDSNYSEQENPSHTFEKIGKYFVTLSVKNSFGESSFTDSLRINITSLQKALVAVVPDVKWGSAMWHVQGVDANNFNGRCYYELSTSSEFNENALALVSLNGNEIEFSPDLKWDPTQYVRVYGLKPLTRYYVRARLEWLSEGETQVSYIDTAEFVTLDMPTPDIFIDEWYPYLTKIKRQNEIIDTDQMLRHETKLFRDMALTEEYTPWRFTSGDMEYIPELGETVYFVYRLTHKLHSDVVRQKSLTITEKNKFICNQFELEEFNYTPTSKGFRIEIPTKPEYGEFDNGLFILNLVNPIPDSSKYYIETEAINLNKNFVSYISYDYPDTLFATLEGDVSFYNLPHTEPLDYSIYTWKGLTWLKSKNRILTISADLFFRIDD